MKHPLIYFLAIILCSIGLFFNLLYLNLFTIGYTFLEYVYFIIRRVECNCLIFGILKKHHYLKLVIML